MPPLNLTNPNTLPYTGCYMALLTSDDNERHAEDDGTCKNVLSKDCLEELIDHVNTTAQSVTGSYMGNSSFFDCTDLTRGLIKDKKSKCWRQWGATASEHFLPDSSLIANATNQDDTSCPSIGHSDPLARTHYTSVSHDDGGPSNFTAYDRELRNPLPLVIATWLKHDDSGAIIWNQGRNFAGTKVICIPANATTPGSRNIAEARKSGGTARVPGLRRVLVGALSILILGLIL
ncbi:hypothetical protein DL98DRAFT_512943 [Cadophora sp. DSE1049]|nr:hypothetical protein DL98DRAFT_512943 [Cadophora sp. DSE1049]